MTLPERGPAREAAILDAAKAGRLEFTWSPITCDARGKRATIWVSTDALKLDGVRVNVTATTAQHVADVLGAHLPTSRICDLAWEQAKVRCKPCLQNPGPEMSSTTAMHKHSAAVDAQVNSKAGLVRNVGKDWILSPRLAGRPDLACNYGWFSPSAPHTTWSGLRAWQPASTRHNRHHVDYSQTLTLVRDIVEVDGTEHRYEDMLRHADLSALLSDDGVMPVTRYPGVAKLDANGAELPAPAAPPPVDLPEIKFIKARNFTPGRNASVGLVVIHTMEAAESLVTAENVAKWFAGSSAPKASAHYCIDADSIVQCVLEMDTAWAAPGANHNGVQLELAGYAKQTPADWADAYSTKMLALVASLTADICRRHSIPVEFVDYHGLRAGQRGITYHREVSKAWMKSTHTDPGKSFPLESFLAMVRAAL